MHRCETLVALFHNSAVTSGMLTATPTYSTKHERYPFQDKSRHSRVITPMKKRHMSTASLLAPSLTRDSKHKFRQCA